MIFGYSVAETRKFVLAAQAAVVTGAHAFGIPVAEDLSNQVIAVYDAITAALVLIVPND